MRSTLPQEIADLLREHGHTEAAEKLERGIQSDAAACSGAVVGRWTPVTESMPDDEITVLVWVASLGEATLAYHDTELLARRKDSGWVAEGSGKRVLIGVTHYCEDICPPNAPAHAPATQPQDRNEDGN